MAVPPSRRRVSLSARAEILSHGAAGSVGENVGAGLPW